MVKSKNKNKMKGITDRPLADMESNGVYFEDEPLNTEEVCQYSGLPALSTYEQPDDKTKK